MTWLPLTWVRRRRLGHRIAFAMVVSLVAVQVQAFLQISLLTQPEMRMTGTRWLAETTAAATRETMALPPERRRAHLPAGADVPVRFGWTKDRPWTKPLIASPVTERLVATLRERLGPDALHIEAMTTALVYMFPVDSLLVSISPAAVAANLGSHPVRADEPDVLIPVNIRIAVQGRDGSWISADPVGSTDTPISTFLPITALLAGGAIIAFVSTQMARRIVAPLDRLIVAAKAIGTSRELVPVPVEGLGEFAAVAQAFEEMQERLIRFVADRTQMLAAISHDLRSSLTRLRLAAEAEPNSIDRQAIQSEVDDMQSMVESTLAFASGEATIAPTQPVDVAALLISLVDEASDLGRLCAYEGPDHCITTAHPMSLKRAFYNLIDNAVKYGQSAHVALQHNSTTIRVTVCDRGPGIPDNLMEDAFQPFRRLDPSRNSELRGAGLGLTIARDAVQSNGGSIRLHNALKGGLIVFVELPKRYSCEQIV